RVWVTAPREKSKGYVQLLDDYPMDRAKRLLERPLPQELADLENSLADQFIAKTASLKIEFDPELRTLLDETIANVDKITHSGSEDCTSYLRSVRVLLCEIAKEA